MNRLTKKRKDGFYELTPNNEIYGEENGIRLVQIIGQLEDCGEEAGINLLILFKALKEGAWFKNPYDPAEISYEKNLEFKIDFSKKCFDIRINFYLSPSNYGADRILYFFKDYGETWALDRKDFINGK